MRDKAFQRRSSSPPGTPQLFVPSLGERPIPGGFDMSEHSSPLPPIVVPPPPIRQLGIASTSYPQRSSPGEEALRSQIQYEWQSPYPATQPSYSQFLQPPLDTSTFGATQAPPLPAQQWPSQAAEYALAGQAPNLANFILGDTWSHFMEQYSKLDH